MIAENTKRREALGIYRFENFVLDAVERRVLKNGEPIQLTTKMFDVLELLVRKNGEIVSKEKILESVWMGRFVEEGSIPVCISNIRKRLGTNKEEPFIKTVSGVGYRLACRVDSSINGKLSRIIKRRSDLQSEKPEDFEFDSVAVLPLRHENGNDEIDYLADGITDSLINNLSATEGFRVLASSTVYQFKNTNKPAHVIGKKLGVSAVLSGKLRLLKDNLIIRIELIRVADGVQLWGTNLIEPFEDILDMQYRITTLISKNLNSSASGVSLYKSESEHSANLESHRFYLKGKYFLRRRQTREIFEQAEKYFMKSLEFDSNNLRSLIGLCESYVWKYIFDYCTHRETKPLVGKILNKIERQGNETPEFYYIKARVALSMLWDFNYAKECLKTSLKLKPDYLEALRTYQFLMAINGKVKEALADTQKIFERDPLCLINNLYVARNYWYLGCFDEALDRLEDSLEYDPDNPSTLLYRAAVLVEKGEYDSAIATYSKLLETEYNYEFLGNMGYAYARSGKGREAYNIIDELEHAGERTYVSPLNSAMIYAALGEHANAFAALDKAYELRISELLTLKVDPRWEAIRQDKRYYRMIEKIGLGVEL